MSETNKVEYTDHPTFNEWLDSSDENTVNIGGFTFPPSKTLYCMSYEQYVELLQSYLADDELFSNEVFTSFPTPVAHYLWQAENNYDNPHHRLDLLKSAWEALIFFLYGLVVGEARHRRIPLKDVGIKLNDYYSDRVAKRLDILENILDYCQKNGIPLNCGQIVTVDAIGKLRHLNRKRNEFAHSFAATPEEQKALYSELLPDMISALRWVSELKRVTIFRYHSNSEGGALFPRCDIFAGHSLDGSKRTLQLPRKDYIVVMDYFNDQSVFALIETEDAVMFCLSPFVHYKRYPQDTHPRIALYKKKLTGGKYEFGIIGQSRNIEIEKAIFESRETELRTLILGPEA